LEGSFHGAIEALSRSVTVGTDENHEYTSVMAEIRKRYMPNTSKGLYHNSDPGTFLMFNLRSGQLTVSFFETINRNYFPDQH
jgi:hypothetical protein